MDNYAAGLEVSADINFIMWSTPNGKPFNAEVARMEAWFNNRIAYLSDKINKL